MRKLILAICIAFTATIAEPKQHNYTFYQKDQINCLVKNIYHEARGEPFQGQVLVAKVTLNRAVTHDNICKVVYAKNQFSWTSQPKLRRLQPKAVIAPQYVQAAYEAQHDPSQAVYFHADYVKPKWSKSKVYLTKVGKHLFYV